MLGGIDEAGRGPVFGPMVVAGISAEDQDRFRELGCRDSKLLTPAKRETLRAGLEGLAREIHAVSVSAEDIDRRRRRETMNQIEVAVFAEIGRKLDVDELFVDAADVNAERFGRLIARRLGRSRGRTQIVSCHRADEIHPCVSAASIVAKVRRDAELRALASPLETKLGQPLGSGYTHDPVTIRFLEAWFDRFGRMPPGTRRSWMTAKEIRSRLNSRVLEEFILPEPAPPPA